MKRFTGCVLRVNTSYHQKGASSIILQQSYNKFQQAAVEQNLEILISNTNHAYERS